MTKDIAIIGAGITGLTSAYYLTKAGHNVTVYEQERYPAMRTSFANGGQISVSNSEVWTTWSNVKKGIKWMFRKDAPLLIRPGLEWAKLKWMVRFLRHTFAGDYEKNTAETIRLGLESRTLYQQLITEEGIEFDHLNSGILHFYKSLDYFERATDAKSIYEDNGCEWSLLEPMQTLSMDPALHEIKGIVGGAWTRDDSTGDIHKFCMELARILETKYNVKFCYNQHVDKFDERFDDYHAIVVSNGVGSAKLAASVGDDIGVYPVKGYSITINNVDPRYLPKVSLLDDEAKIVTSTLGNRLRVAGTAELTGENYDIRRDRIEPLLNWVHTNFPNIDTSDYTSWACLRPMTPNMMPVVRQSKKDMRVFYNTGHGHLGWTLSPATAVALSKMI